MNRKQHFVRRYSVGLLICLLFYWLVSWVVYFKQENLGWHEVLLFVCWIYGIGFAWVYNTIHTQNPEQSPWVILGNKIVKMLLTIMSIVAVWALTDISLKVFSVDLLFAYFVCLIYEMVFFVRENKQ